MEHQKQYLSRIDSDWYRMSYFTSCRRRHQTKVVKYGSWPSFFDIGL